MPETHGAGGATGGVDGYALVGDIGGTHARFALLNRAGELVRPQVLECSNYPSLVAATREYLSGVEPQRNPVRAAIAVACPVLDDRVKMTNHGWTFSVAEARRQLDLEVLEVLNDFSALALALPVLVEENTRTLKPGRREPRAPLALLGPGTGLGVSALIPSGQSWVALSTEGGHCDLAASTAREWLIIERLQERFGRASGERVLSGPGLVNLHRAICELAGTEVEAHEPEQIVQGAREDSCPECQEAVQMFSRQLGAVAGDLALTFGARGGIFLGGGVIPKMGEVFDVELFRDGFLSKGRFRKYLEPIPVRLIVETKAALLGAARALQSVLATGVRKDAVGGR